MSVPHSVHPSIRGLWARFKPNFLTFVIHIEHTGWQSRDEGLQLAGLACILAHKPVQPPEVVKIPYLILNEPLNGEFHAFAVPGSWRGGETIFAKK